MDATALRQASLTNIIIDLRLQTGNRIALS
jgi:hypothetical protein